MIALYAKKRSFHHLYINDNQLSNPNPNPNSNRGYESEDFKYCKLCLLNRYIDIFYRQVKIRKILRAPTPPRRCIKMRSKKIYPIE